MSAKTLAWLCCVVISATITLAQDTSLSKQPAEKMTGTWHCQFETPFGMQTYHLHVAVTDAGGATVEGEVESRGEERKGEFVDVKVDGDSIAFAEVRQFGEREFRIEYSGQLKEKELALTRSFGQGGGQESVATRELPKPPPKEEVAPVVEVQIDRIIKDAFKDSFLIGMAGDLPSRYSNEELELAAEHFGSITPENCMKPERIHPAEDRWAFERSDALVDWGQKNDMTIHGHTLVWHAQTPDWFFEGRDPETIKRRMKEHVETLVGRYKGKLQSWDVVNEAINDGGDSETAKTENLRNSNWLQALGPEFFTLAFKFAREADPDAVLYYNDYNIESGPKHASSMVLLRRLLAEGAPIDAVGIQGHWRSGRVPFEDIDQAIADYASLGLKVSITELDVTIRGESGGQFGRRRLRSSSPPSVEDLNAQAEDYAKLFAIFQKHEDVIERVTFWGLNDRRTWRWGQHPLLFDANNNLKPAYAAIVNGKQRATLPDSSKPVVFTTQEDHRNMLEQLGITKLRPGRNGDADAPNGANYDEAKANPYPKLPEILMTAAGEKVATPEQWKQTRRPELVSLLETHLYGRIPETVPEVKWEVVGTREVEAGGKPAIQKHIVGTVDNSACPEIEVNISMSLTLPKGVKGSVPVLMTFGWTPFEPNPFARFARRGGDDGPRPPTKRDLLIAAGWGCAMINPATIQDDAGGWQRRRFSGSPQPEDVEPTGAGLTRGIIGLTNRGQPRKPDQWGALRAWGWGASRALDYLETVPEVDEKRVGIAGVSRYGKAALVTMAFDERFAMGLIASSGAGGTALHRRNFGESLENLAGSGEYHWMCGNYLQYAAEESSFGRKTADDLPVDSHMMLALCAPRLTFISHGIPEQGDALWLDHQGSFMAAIAAQPVYRLLGAKDLGRSDDYMNERMPAVNVDLLDGALAWRQHDGGHTDRPNVEHFIRWAESQWASKSQKNANDATKRSLKDAVGDRFKLGVGVSHRVLASEADASLIRQHFSILTPENCMKPQSIHPAEDVWNFDATDGFVDFARENQLEVVGHCLVWAKDDRTDEWMMEEDGKPVSREELLSRIETHIDTVVARYGDAVTTWDVVNEAIGDSDEGLLRDSVYSRTTGMDFIVTAFKAARAADPDALLIYNDYNGHNPAKREKLIELLTKLKAAGAPVDAFGMQGHFELGDDPLPELRETFNALRDLNLQVVVSELDIDVVKRGRWWAEDGKYREELRSADPYKDGLPPKIEQLVIDQYVALFRLFDEYSDVIARVSFWNLHDGQSWLNYFPWERTNYPLLFDRDRQPKPAFDAVYKLLKERESKTTTSSHDPWRRDRYCYRVGDSIVANPNTPSLVAVARYPPHADVHRPGNGNSSTWRGRLSVRHRWRRTPANVSTSERRHEGR